MPLSKILIVDDEPFNVDYLEQELDDLGYATVAAVNGQDALAKVEAEAPDLILLDIMMPILDGFGVLERLKANPATRDIPVIIISANTDMPSIVRGIKLGAEDYLPKPFEPVLLQARISSGLDKKLRRDLELEYLRQVEHLTAAAEAVQGSNYEATLIAPVANRPDALGNLARVFQKMAGEVVAREQRLKQQLHQLQLDIEEQRNSATDTAALYIPMDRRQALAHAATLPSQTLGAALFADISGFTALTETFARELGLQRGAEEITRQINQIHTVLIDNVHDYGGSVLGFSGDAITCWFEAVGTMDEAELRALACALAIQASLKRFAHLTTPNGTPLSIGVKVALASGSARRWLVGNPNQQVFDILAGRTLDALAEAEYHTQPGEVVAPQSFATNLGERAIISEWRAEDQFAVLSGLTQSVASMPWPAVPENAISNQQAQTWLPPAVFEKVQNGQSAFLSELRPAAPLFLNFGGIDYDHDPEAQSKLDDFIQWVQSTLAEFEGLILQITMGDKGSYLYIVLGAPISHLDDAARAVLCALKLQQPPAQFAYLTDIRLGVTYGQMRAGAYGSPAQRTYGALGDKTNLAARLMIAAQPNTALCDQAIYDATRDRVQFQVLPPLQVKGKSQPINVYRPLNGPVNPQAESVTDVSRAVQRALLIDHLSPADQLALKAASVIGRVFSFEVLQAIYPDAEDKAGVAEQLQTLTDLNLIVLNTNASAQSYTFIDSITQETAYSLMLFAQRRQLHRAIAEWHEQNYSDNLRPYLSLLAHHWRAADEPLKAIDYFEQAGAHARQSGDSDAALHYFNEALALETRS